MTDQFYKLPRLFLDQGLKENAPLALDQDAAHYFRSVLRRQVGDQFRVFNGRDGEWIANIQNLGKKNGTAAVTQKIKDQPSTPNPIHLIFSPIKKQRLNILIEKAVELGVTDLHPVLCARSENRKVNEERTKAQITEALEQCERMVMPQLHPLTDLKTTIQTWGHNAPILACLERHDAPHLNSINEKNYAFLIGPEGGFDESEIKFLTSHSAINPVSLGQTIYRAETACIICLVHANAQAQSRK